MNDLVQRIRDSKEISSTADWEINRLKVLGASNRDIKKMLRDMLKNYDIEINRIYSDVLEKSYVRDKALYEALNLPQIPFKDNKELQAIIAAYRDQTKGEFTNITRTIGFAKKSQSDGKMVFTRIAEYYQRTLDSAITDIATGTFDYNTVLKRVVSEMTSSGLRTATFASGKTFRIESAARTALMTGLNQTISKMNDSLANDLNTDTFEVDWHGGARPSHQAWQGKVYTRQQLVTVCGLGSVMGLLGANCYHSYFPFVKGASVRQYTDKQLNALNEQENKPKTYADREYTTYQATQRQRQMEVLMRKQKQEVNLLKLGGANEEDITLSRARYRATSSQYADFSKAMDIPQQKQRVTVDNLRRV